MQNHPLCGWIFIRKGEVLKWLEAYRRSREYVRIYKYYLGEEQKLLQKEDFIEADRIVREYQILRCSLNDKDKELLERFLIRGETDDAIKILRSPDIVANWELIVLSSGKHSFEPFDPVAFGKKLKEFREHKGFYRAEAARYLEISENTLRSYEDGKRIIRVDIFFRILELYGVSIDCFIDD